LSALAHPHRFVLAVLALCLALGLPPAAGAKQRAKPGLPLSAVPVSTRTGDNAGAVKLILRPIKRAKLAGPVRIALRNSSGKLVSRKKVGDPGGGEKIVSLGLKRPLKAGTYRVRMVGRKAKKGGLFSATRKLVFADGGGWAGAEVVGGTLVQKVVVDWYDGEPGGRDLGGFVAPGIGYGEITCRPDAQYVRFFGSSGGRETAMMNWTYKDWGTFQEKSLREAVYTTGTGFDFTEGLNKFGPAEKTSTGSFEGVISDRGPIGGPGGGPLAPVTTLSLSWQWDFTQPAESHCHVEAVFRTEAEAAATLARSLQLVWRGEQNAAANGAAAVDFPGLGLVSIQCRPGEPRRLRIDSPRGARIISREGSEDSLLSEPAGPVEASLPNNGMAVVEVLGGERILLASRWKLNDPDPATNWCAIAAQVTSQN
jgi:hypothetical protein